MAELAVKMGLKAIPVACNHYDLVWDPIQHRYKKARGKIPQPDPDVHDNRTMEEKGYVLRKRSEVQSDEEIVDVVRHRGEVAPRRRSRKPGMIRRSSSMGDTRDGGYRGRSVAAGAAGGAAAGAGAGYESEGSVPPRSRVRARSQASKSRRRGGSSSSSSTSSSDLGSSTDDEKQCKKMSRKKWISAALASVATIHAASSVYNSIEEHDKRIIQVQKGEISPEEAHKKQRAARWQDAASIGIAALGIKGAVSEWNEVTQEHREHMEMIEKNKERHQKRLEHQRRLKARERGGYYKGRDGQWYYDGPELQHSEKRRNSQIDGPRNGERKLLEGPNESRSGGRSRSTYNDNDYSYDYDYDSRYNDSRSRTRSQYNTTTTRDKSRARTEYTDDRARSRYTDRGGSRYDDDDY